MEENKLHARVWRMGYSMNTGEPIAFCPQRNSCSTQRKLHRMSKGKASSFAAEGNALFIILSLCSVVLDSAELSGSDFSSFPSHLPFSASALLPSWHLSFSSSSSCQQFQTQPQLHLGFISIPLHLLKCITILCIKC